MKRRLVILATLALSAFALAGTASAATIDQRQFRQHERIHGARHRHQLTRAELIRLRMGQASIRRMERLAWADGRLTMRERIALQRALDRQGMRIGRFAHNRHATIY